MSISPNRVRTLAERSDDTIDYSDIPQLDDRFFEAAELVQLMGKAQVTMRIDSDVLDWFRAQGKGYQTRMNAVLKAYMITQSKR
ncbi:BrnA antitoxin family protein [Rhizobium straminoryzae]|uniref:BrnA antitoxin family protein n=1 Tax=Rhizobium straminoryzae TaxID=1387186 RepID=A0A549TIW7_9HYPH|nr:BrnA antitoxin family protein [Rhizobium straminoryzae]